MQDQPQSDSLIGRQQNVGPAHRDPLPLRIVERLDLPANEIADADAAPLVIGQQAMGEAERLQPGSEVKMHINGEALPRMGEVTQLRHDGDLDSLGSDVVVVVQPESALPMDLVSRPARVSAVSESWLSSESLTAALGMRAEAQQ